MYISNTQQIRRADQIQIEEKGVPGILLMETAGREAALAIAELYSPEEIASCWILAGPGNNGGDGLVIARYLHLWGWKVRVWFSHEPARYQGDARVMADILAHLPIPQEVFDSDKVALTLGPTPAPHLLIDALLGTGITSTLRGPVEEIIAYFRAYEWPTIAIDLPSGLSADTGMQINEVLSATHTLTFQLPKLCHYVTPAAKYCGKVWVKDIGIWPGTIEQLDIQRIRLDRAWAANQYIGRQVDGHKGTFGHVVVIGGSRDMAGAVAMTALAAKKAGAGLCTVIAPYPCREAVYAWCPEAMMKGMGNSDTEVLESGFIAAIEPLLKRASAVVLGPGMGQHPDTREFMHALLPKISLPLILDADGLNILSSDPALWDLLPVSTLITPHPGEMRRLVGEKEVNHRRLECAEEMAQERKTTVVLKGAGTIVACSNGNTYINTSGNPGMGTGGAGDVLGGIIGGLLAQGYQNEIAAALGVFLHGWAGDIASEQHSPEGLTATQIAMAMEGVWKELREPQSPAVHK